MTGAAKIYFYANVLKIATNRLLRRESKERDNNG